MAVPKLRFKADNGSEFPEWEGKTLGELGNFIKGAPLSKADISEGGLPIILYGELYTTYKEVAYDIKNHTNGDIDKKYLSQIGDIVIPTSGETAKEISTATCVMKEGVVLAGDLYIYRTSNNINGQIMSYLFNHQINNDIARIAQGKSIVHIRASELCKLVVQYPGSVCEQKKIVDFLSTLDTIIKNCQSEVETWEKYKRGVMQQLFSQNVRFKADDGSEYPKWEEKTLGELGEFFKGAPLSKADISEEGLPIILYGELYTTYEEVTNDIKKHTKADVSNRYLSKMGDVVIPTSGETPEEISTATCVMKDNVVLAGDLYIYRTSNALDGRLMSYLLNHQINNDIARIAQGKSIVHVHAKEICKLVVQYPSSISEQQKIVDCLSAFDEVIDKAKQKLEAYKQLKKGLLQQMFV